MKKNRINYFVMAAGLVLLGVGLFLVKSVADPQGIMLSLPYVLVGFGCGAFGHGMGNIINARALKNSPQLQKQLEIEKNDERNTAIQNRAKAKAYDIMVYVFGALYVSFALMRVDMTVVLLLVAAYLFVIGGGVYYRCKYDKEM